VLQSKDMGRVSGVDIHGNYAFNVSSATMGTSVHSRTKGVRSTDRRIYHHVAASPDLGWRSLEGWVVALGYTSYDTLERMGSSQ
jgi:hypothetical protein